MSGTCKVNRPRPSERRFSLADHPDGSVVRGRLSSRGRPESPGNTSSEGSSCTGVRRVRECRPDRPVIFRSRTAPTPSTAAMTARPRRRASPDRTTKMPASTMTTPNAIALAVLRPLNRMNPAGIRLPVSVARRMERTPDLRQPAIDAGSRDSEHQRRSVGAAVVCASSGHDTSAASSRSVADAAAATAPSNPQRAGQRYDSGLRVAAIAPLFTK